MLRHGNTRWNSVRWIRRGAGGQVGDRSKYWIEFDVRLATSENRGPWLVSVGGGRTSWLELWSPAGCPGSFIAATHGNFSLYPSVSSLEKALSIPPYRKKHVRNVCISRLVDPNGQRGCSSSPSFLSFHSIFFFFFRVWLNSSFIYLALTRSVYSPFLFVLNQTFLFSSYLLLCPFAYASLSLLKIFHALFILSFQFREMVSAKYEQSLPSTGFWTL